MMSFRVPVTLFGLVALATVVAFPVGRGLTSALQAPCVDMSQPQSSGPVVAVRKAPVIVDGNIISADWTTIFGGSLMSPQSQSTQLGGTVAAPSDAPSTAATSAGSGGAATTATTGASTAGMAGTAGGTTTAGTAGSTSATAGTTGATTATSAGTSTTGTTGSTAATAGTTGATTATSTGTTTAGTTGTGTAASAGTTGTGTAAPATTTGAPASTTGAAPATSGFGSTPPGIPFFGIDWEANTFNHVGSCELFFAADTAQGSDLIVSLRLDSVTSQTTAFGQGPNDYELRVKPDKTWTLNHDLNGSLIPVDPNVWKLEATVAIAVSPSAGEQFEIGLSDPTGILVPAGRQLGVRADAIPASCTTLPGQARALTAVTLADEYGPKFEGTPGFDKVLVDAKFPYGIVPGEDVDGKFVLSHLPLEYKGGTFTVTPTGALAGATSEIHGVLPQVDRGGRVTIDYLGYTDPTTPIAAGGGYTLVAQFKDGPTMTKKIPVEFWDVVGFDMKPVLVEVNARDSGKGKIVEIKVPIRSHVRGAVQGSFTATPPSNWTLLNPGSQTFVLDNQSSTSLRTVQVKIPSSDLQNQGVYQIGFSCSAPGHVVNGSVNVYVVVKPT